MHTEVQVDTVDRTRHTGVLQQWEASLTQYKGQNILIAFRHQSDDDNLLSMGDILVLGTGSVGIEENNAAISFGLYSNPAAQLNKVNLEHKLDSPSNVSYSITNVDGKVLKAINGHRQLAGAHQFDIDASLLPIGTYLLSLNTSSRAAKR